MILNVQLECFLPVQTWKKWWRKIHWPSNRWDKFCCTLMRFLNAHLLVFFFPLCWSTNIDDAVPTTGVWVALAGPEIFTFFEVDWARVWETVFAGRTAKKWVMNILSICLFCENMLLIWIWFACHHLYIKLVIFPCFSILQKQWVPVYHVHPLWPRKEMKQQTERVDLLAGYIWVCINALIVPDMSQPQWSVGVDEFQWVIIIWRPFYENGGKYHLVTLPPKRKYNLPVKICDWSQFEYVHEDVNSSANNFISVLSPMSIGNNSRVHVVHPHLYCHS